LKLTPSFKENKNFKTDLYNILVGIIWQTAIVATPVFLVLGKWMDMSIALLIVLITSVVLKVNWWDKLPND